MQVMILETADDKYTAYAIEGETHIVIAEHPNLIAAIGDIKKRMYGNIQVNVITFPNDETEWQVLDEVPPTQANERKAK